MSDKYEPGGQFDSRLNELEREAAATRSDIRGIYAGLDEIRAVLVRIQEGSKPNLNALFVAILGTCSVLITVGGLSLAPINRNVDRIDQDLGRIEAVQAQVASTRFTAKDAENLRLNMTDRMERDEGRLSELTSRIAFLEGRIKGAEAQAYAEYLEYLRHQAGEEQ